MKTLVSILMTILGILSPALSSQAQEADRFPGEFKEIHSIDDFTEGYYLIVAPVDNKYPMRALTKIIEDKKKNVGECEELSDNVLSSATSVTSPFKQAVWKVERSADGKSFTIQNFKTKKYLSSDTRKNNTLNWSDNPENFPIDSYNPRTADWGCKFTFSKNNRMWFAFNTNNKLYKFVFCGRDERPTQHTHSPRFFKLVAQETNQLTISSVKCATFYSEKAMKLPAGLTAHVGEVDAQHGVVHLKAIGSVVPANTAVIITGEPGTYTLTATTETAQPFAKNDLKGTSTNITASAIAAAPEAYYALSINQGQPCFGILERDLPAGKAYFTQPKSAGTASQFLSDFIISSVQHVQQKAEEGPLYDLNGRAVTQPVKGNIYVRNGKKFIYLR